MKSAGSNLLYFVVAGTLAAQPAEPVPPAKTSTRLTQEIRAALPKYAPPAAGTPGTAAPESTPPDPNLLVLPKVTVQEKRIPMDDPDLWLGERAIQQKAMAAYKASMTDLEWALNSWHIPFITPSAASRARAAYEANKRRAVVTQINDAIARIEELNPKEAAKLRRGMDPRRLPKDDD